MISATKEKKFLKVEMEQNLEIPLLSDNDMLNCWMRAFIDKPNQEPKQEINKVEPILAERLLKYLPAYQSNAYMYSDAEINKLANSFIAETPKQV